MQTKHFLRAGVLTAVLVIAFVVCWEGYWRSRGFIPTYHDDEALWAEKRDDVYQPGDAATVFIGSSRIKFDLDIPTWEAITGEKAVQLSIVGTSPRRLLNDLANDVNFKGKLVMDVTEGLFFARGGRDKSANEAIEFYKNYTPAQKASSKINYPLESAFVFLEKNKFGLNELLNGLKLPMRKGTRSPPLFPKEFGWTTYDRQTYMSSMFLADTNLQRRQTNIWMGGALNQGKGISGDTLLNVFKEVKNNIDKIRSRGGQVVMVRTPSSDPLLAGEKKGYPRQEYWDALLKYTNTVGVHFEDDPATAHYTCPEWSHLSTKDAIDYTKHLVRKLEEQGWTFRKKSLAGL